MDHEAGPWGEFGGPEEPLLSPDFARKVLRRARAEKRGRQIQNGVTGVVGGCVLVALILVSSMTHPLTQRHPIKVIPVETADLAPVATRDFDWTQGSHDAFQADPFLVFLPDAQSVMNEIPD
jgi:hypothetical protein